ncbi:NapC/NirT family cytochrome c [Sedimenticola sp.]|uniref:NapC/NirT family cytochrome c n=2 Tax=Sedimenticola TaxID=349742 RepID=UPI00068495D2|nr:NapC/NirT family cytochrome c [Sedimenticola sp.]MCW8903854.1 NapC/NirT family cytochrome c [Sedimenticola sp.]
MMLKRFWQWFRSPSKAYAWGTIFIIGAVFGVVSWGGFNTFMEYTNTMEFCVSCHEMEQTVYQEYKQTVHYSNPSGVRAICSDCHVPKPWTAKIWRKIKASNELYHKMVGTIDTKEKFEARRLLLAERVWAGMIASDSRECRNCHSYHSMDFLKQRQRSREKMQEAMEQGKTCIECHKGIAHKRPISDDEFDD